MGVQGLTSFIENHQNLYREVRFSRSRLVIDGCNLNYLLYCSSGLDENHGGEYAAYESLIESFITALRTCEIAPYVVLDGGSGLTDRKAETAVKRAEDRINKKNRASVNGQQNKFLPRMADFVFRQTLARLEVPMAQCFEEADQEIAALASEWQCPVLSNDSDFYVFHLPAGFLPTSHFQWKEVKGSGSRSYISCRRFYTSSFCAFFGLQHQLLPAFAALAGNDYVKQRGIKWAKFVPAGRETNRPQLEGLLCWLKNFQDPQEALEAAVVLMGQQSENKKEVLHRLHVGMEEYEPRGSKLSRFFLHGAPPEFPALEEEGKLVPDWMRLPLTLAQLSGCILNVLCLLSEKKQFTKTVEKIVKECSGTIKPPQSSPEAPSAQAVNHHPEADPGHLLSANVTSRPIRQVMYGLLLGREKSIQVPEFDREGLQLIFISVEPVFTRVSERLRLCSLQEAALSDRLRVLLEALGVSEESLGLLPPRLKLPAAVTCYWLQRAQPPPDLLKALLQGMSNESTPTPTTALLAEPDQKLDQWQACLKDAIHLNQLLGFPLPEPDIARLYQGTLVHQLVHRMRTGGRLKTLLKSDGPSKKLYRTMLSMVQSQAQRVLVASENLQKAPTHQQQDLKDLKDLSTNLQHQDEETENEVQTAMAAQEEHLLVRTRYRTKERSSRCSKPELARKEECRGWDLL
ncbi:protein asteroid homolog 1-like [Fundulus heteroclitus]|uniref:protein asteroid homolog 1-like n=1 Tax=Fundulus heteroclitus TaxID=8078 RepID=UPI00165C9D13|nr:protein asteroid homolog 1-like [Fundulus heteroclitus]